MTKAGASRQQSIPPFPPNGFILFRVETMRLAKESNSELLDSKRIGEMWRQLSSDEQGYWLKKSRALREEHLAKYPREPKPRRRNRFQPYKSERKLPVNPLTPSASTPAFVVASSLSVERPSPLDTAWETPTTLHETEDTSSSEMNCSEVDGWWTAEVYNLQSSFIHLYSQTPKSLIIPDAIDLWNRFGVGIDEALDRALACIDPSLVDEVNSAPWNICISG